MILDLTAIPVGCKSKITEKHTILMKHTDQHTILTNAHTHMSTTHKHYKDLKQTKYFIEYHSVTEQCEKKTLKLILTISRFIFSLHKLTWKLEIQIKCKKRDQTVFTPVTTISKGYPTNLCWYCIFSDGYYFL